jgi:hypothetical protein
MKSNQLLRATLCAAALACMQAGCEETPKSYTRDQLKQFTATVASVNVPDRQIELVAPDGRRQSFSAGPEVRSLDQVRAGDRVVLSYYEGLAAAIRPAGTPAQLPQETETREAAPKGAKPGAGVAETRSTTVKIDSVDTSLNTVTFQRADGMTRTVDVKDPDAQKFIRKLKPGDAVEITYTEALAVDVKPAQ